MLLTCIINIFFIVKLVGSLSNKVNTLHFIFPAPDIVLMLPLAILLSHPSTIISSHIDEEDKLDFKSKYFPIVDEEEPNIIYISPPMLLSDTPPLRLSLLPTPRVEKGFEKSRISKIHAMNSATCYPLLLLPLNKFLHISNVICLFYF